MIRYAEKLQIVPLRFPQASTAADLETAHMKMKNAQWISFLCFWGELTSDQHEGTIKVYTATDASTTNAISQPFKYRLSSATGNDLWGAISSATAASGYTLAGTADNRALLIDVDPATLLKLDPDAEYIHLLIDGGTLETNPAFGVMGILEPRYPQNLNLTSS
jgi:hypothetical protein